MNREQAIASLENIVAWAEAEGYDPKIDYTDQFARDPGYISKHFHKGEFACNCCGRIHPDGVPGALVDYLEAIRDEFGDKPVNINSGYRCPAHNANVGGATKSQHLKGQAVDLWIEGVSPAKVFDFCCDLIGDHGGVGKYDTFTHIDVRGSKARW